MIAEEQKPEPPNCQQCRIRPATHKVPISSGAGFRWKCQICYEKKGPSGFRTKKLLSARGEE